MKVIYGTAAAPGTGLAVCFWYAPQKSGGIKRSLEEAVEAADKEYSLLAAKAKEKGAEDMAQLFETYRLLLCDPDLEDGINSKIAEGTEPADAVIQTGEELAVMLSALDDEYLRSRAEDIKGVCRRLQAIMNGSQNEEIEFDNPVILAAVDLTPAETLQLNTKNIKGIILAEGTKNGHTAILAGMLGIPCIVGLGSEINSELDGICVAADGNLGVVLQEPDAAEVQRYMLSEKEQTEEKRILMLYKDSEAVTSTGKRIKVYCNISSAKEAAAALEQGCEGIGLFRTEFLYLSGSTYPDEEYQYKEYKSILEQMKDKEVVIRTCDIGADKTAAYFNLPQEENPALGLRAIRLCLQRPKMFLTQLTALYRASVWGSLSIMFPMITSLNELLQAKEMCRRAMDDLKSRGIAYREDVKIGVMIETPAAALISSDLAVEADFFSCGTNDLTQYTLAADRQSDDIGYLFDAAHPAVKALLAMSAGAAHSAGIPIGICGSSAADPELMEFYAEIGIDELSVNSSQILKVKKNICSI